MRRREFIGALGGMATWPQAARASQAERARSVAILFGLSETDMEAQSWFALLRQEMLALGWIEGRNIRVEYRWTAGDPARARSFADELLGFHPDVVLATNTVTLTALKERTSRVPIIFLQVSDPLGNGFVQSLSRPGGNITGFAHFDYEIGGKWVQLLKDAVPTMRRAGIVFGLENPASQHYLRMAEHGAAALQVEALAYGARGLADIERAIANLSRIGDAGLVVQPSPLTIRQRQEIVSLAARHGIPSIYPFRFFTAAGGLLSYGVHTGEQYRQAAGYIDRILRGEAPGSLPVQAPTRFELVINLRTAKALQLTIPPPLLARADEVIE